ncbi:MAG: DUF420 domain-containing protein [Deltaproteobacteria bacterium]|nr:DUF420 domain-containing protein [Deltaproteobacteria bacterium]
MSAHTGFWTFAFLNMIAAFIVAAAGVLSVRRRNVELHRKLMLVSAALVGLFVVSYAGKLAFLGREDLGAWPDLSVVVLRVHEAFVFTFLVSGIRAYVLSRRVAASPDVKPAHRLAGRVSMASFALALVTAAIVYRSILSYGKLAVQ